MIAEGLYALTYAAQSEGNSDCGSALAVLRDGKILGSDCWGGIFSGSYGFDAAKEKNSVRLRMQVPPGGELITGFAAGPEGAIIDIVGTFDRASPFANAVANVAGCPVNVHLSYLGALPN